MGTAEKFSRVRGMEFAYGVFFGLFWGALFSNLFLPALQAQPGSSDYFHMENFRCRMPEHEHGVHKLS